MPVMKLAMYRSSRSTLKACIIFVVSCVLCISPMIHVSQAFCPSRTAGAGAGTGAASSLPVWNRNSNKQHDLASSKHQQQLRNHNIRRTSDSAVKPLQATTSGLSASLLSSPLASLILLAGVVLVHESGHYLAARSLGIQVEEFSIGVGPKLFGFKAFNGDEFNLRAIPLGGYVRFPENFNVTLVQQQERKAWDSLRAFEAKQDKDVKFKILNALTLGSLSEKRWKEEKERRARRNEEASTSKPWWSRISLSPAKAAQDAVTDSEEAEIFDFEDVKIDYYQDPNLLQNRPWFQRAVVLSAGIIFNLLLSYFIYFGEISYGPGVPQPIFEPGALVSAMPRPDAAASGILRKGDVIVSVNGMPVSQSQSPIAAEAQKSITNVISKIRATPDGASLHLTVLHPGDTTPVEVDVRPKRAVDDGPQTIGVLLSPNFVQSKVIRANSFWEASVRAAQYVGTLTADTAQGLVSILSDVTSGKGAGNQISGPIGLIKTGSEIVATQDWSTVLMFAAAISINLAVVNAFPLPALDGGQLAFVISEALSGRKIDQRVQEGISGAALFFLLLVSVGAAFSDIESIFMK